MKQKRTRDAVKLPGKSGAANGLQRAQPGGHGWGARWHAGRFRMALWLAVVAVGVMLAVAQESGPLAQWLFRDGYVATRATVVKARYWADALEAKPQTDEAIAGWHIDLRVGDHPFALAVALSDFDPDKNYFDQKYSPDKNRFAEGSVHPVWFYADNKLKQPETVALLQSPPALLISRAASARFPAFSEAIENSIEFLIAPALLLAIAAIYLLLSLVGKKGGDTAGSPLATRLTTAIVACLVAGGAYLVNNEHPLAVHEEQYVPAEIEITRAPFADDKLTYFRGVRVLWRTWQVEAKLTAPGAQMFTIDVDGLDPRRAPWASRHSPDFSVFQPGNKLAVWQSDFHRTTLDNLGSVKPVIYWETFLSRERWPEKYTPRDYVKDNPIATMIIAIALLFALIALLPLGGQRVEPR